MRMAATGHIAVEGLTRPGQGQRSQEDSMPEGSSQEGYPRPRSGRGQGGATHVQGSVAAQRKQT